MLHRFYLRLHLALKINFSLKTEVKLKVKLRFQYAFKWIVQFEMKSIMIIKFNIGVFVFTEKIHVIKLGHHKRHFKFCVFLSCVIPERFRIILWGFVGTDMFSLQVSL